MIAQKDTEHGDNDNDDKCSNDNSIACVEDNLDNYNNDSHNENNKTQRSRYFCA